MANVIYLKDHARTPRRTVRAQGEEGPAGRVLLFTGVRYERLAPSPLPTNTTPRLAKP